MTDAPHPPGPPRDASAPGSTNPVAFTAGAPETVLPPPDPAAAEATAAAMAGAPERRRAEVSTADADRYAFARVGYHRGLDALRAAEWRGTGLVRWAHEENRGFLRSLDALRAAAAAIGETDEAERCRQFLHQLDPDWRD